MGTYFFEQYQNINYPRASGNRPGLRNAQLGAIHAISSFFTLRKAKAAIVVMPTGERVIIVTGCINALVSRVSGTLNRYISRIT